MSLCDYNLPLKSQELIRNINESSGEKNERFEVRINTCIKVSHCWKIYVVMFKTTKVKFMIYKALFP